MAEVNREQAGPRQPVLPLSTPPSTLRLAIHLCWLRFRLARHQVSRRGGIFQVIAGFLLTAGWIALSLGLAVATAVIAGILLGNDSVEAVFVVRILLVSHAFVAILFTIMVHSGGVRIPIDMLLFYPIDRGRLRLVALLGSALDFSGLIWWPSLLSIGAAACFYRPRRTPLMFIGVALLGATYIAVTYSVGLATGLLLARRRLREAGAVVGIALLTAASLLPLWLDSHDQNGSAPLSASVAGAVGLALIDLTPPGACARFLAGGVAEAKWLFVLAGWLCVSLLSARRLFAAALAVGQVGEPSRVGSRRRRGTLLRGLVDRFSLSRRPELAIAWMQWRYLLRSGLGRLSIALGPLLVAVIVIVARRGMAKWTSSEMPLIMTAAPALDILFAGFMYWTSLLLQSHFYNSFAWDGAGLRVLLLSPVSARRILAGKNLGVFLFQILLGALTCIVFAVIVGFPGLSGMAAGWLILAANSVLLSATGNLLSIQWPIRRDMGSMKNNTSFVSGLLGMFILAASTAILLVCLVGGRLLLGRFFLLPLICWTATVVAVYLLSLRPLGAYLWGRRENLLGIIGTERE